MCSETSSPRLSFSSDVLQEDQDLHDDHDHDRYHHHNTSDTSSLMDMSCEFEFSFTCGFSADQESSTADELFSHGIIIPTQPIETPKNHIHHNNNNIIIFPSKSETQSLPPHPKRESQKEAPNKSHQSKSIWGTLKRSTSLNCDSKRSTSLLFSLPPLLSRSNSTGSVPHQKRASSASKKQPLPRSSSTNNNSNNGNSYWAMPQKPPVLKKGYGFGGSYGNGVRIIPVINVPPPYVCKSSAKLFGLGSFLHHGNKDRSNKKWL